MKIISFFKLVNRKINKYDRLASNPFWHSKEPVTIIWVESDNKEK